MDVVDNLLENTQREYIRQVHSPRQIYYYNPQRQQKQEARLKAALIDQY